ncbi:MAG: hypothetical protein KY443_07110 [Actinobacteria bacterium]|nr:hypothetical protein [Actinomycetota bacterium]
MESAGTTPHVAVNAPDLAEVLQAPGPFATVYLATVGDVDNAAQRSELRWRGVRDALADAGAPESTLEEIDALVPDAHHRGQCLSVVANGDGVLHVEHHPEEPKRDIGRWAPLPSLVPVLEWRQSSPPHLVVLADRTGADVIGFRRELPDVMREAGDQDGDAVRKVHPGGWSQRRYQERAENAWEHNADAAAAEVARMAERIGARLIVAAGDVRALQLLRDALPRELADLLAAADGNRAPDGSAGTTADDAVRLVADAVARDTVALIEKFREEKGQGDRAAAGAARTMEALAQGRVEVLLVDDDAMEDTPIAWFGPEPTMVGMTEADVKAFGVDTATAARLPDVAVRAALLTSAGVRVVPGAVLDGDPVAAILRW